MENELYTIYSSWFFSLLYFCRLLLYFVSFIITFSRIYLGGTWKRSSPHLPQFFFVGLPLELYIVKKTRTRVHRSYKLGYFLFHYLAIIFFLCLCWNQLRDSLTLCKTEDGAASNVERYPNQIRCWQPINQTKTFYRAVRGEKIVIPVCTLNIVHKVWAFGKCFRWCWQMWLKYATV